MTSTKPFWHTIMGRSMLREDEVTIGQVFTDAGYATGMFGKWHLGDNYPFRPEDRGYMEVMRHGGGGVGQTPDYWDNAYFDGAYFHNSKPETVQGFCTDVWFRYATDFIAVQKQKGVPFFAYISTNAPHGPMLAPEKASTALSSSIKKSWNSLKSIRIAPFFYISPASSPMPNCLPLKNTWPNTAAVTGRKNPT